MIGRLFFFFSAWSLMALGANQRMTVTFRYKGEVMKATFFSTTRTVCETVEEAEDRRRATDYLDNLRFEHYTDRDSDMSEAEKRDWRANFFNWEKLARHDELMVIHRGEAPRETVPGNPVPLGIGKDIVAMIAVDRLGDTMLDCLPGYDSQTYERFLLEQRLAPLGLQIPREIPSVFVGNAMPKGMFKHWEPYIAQTYFTPQTLIIGDVIQANALFAHEGTWPLVHSLANGYGLFSTGRIIPKGKSKVINGIEYIGPRAFVPTLVVWEVFNKMKDGRIRKGSRTKYYEKSGGVPLVIGGSDQWRDPRLFYDNYVQIMSKTGDQFRGGWTEHFARHENFDFVRDVTILRTEFESMNGKALYSQPVPQWAQEIEHHPHHLNRCIADMLNPTPLQTLNLELKISVSIGQPVITYPSQDKK